MVSNSIREEAERQQLYMWPLTHYANLKKKKKNSTIGSEKEASANPLNISDIRDQPDFILGSQRPGHEWFFPLCE